DVALAAVSASSRAGAGSRRRSRLQFGYVSFQRQSVRFARPTRRDRFDPESADRARPVAAFSAGDSRDFRGNGRDAGLAGDDWHWANDAMTGARAVEGGVLLNTAPPGETKFLARL